MWKWGRFQSVGFSKLITTGDFPCIWLHHIQLFPLISCPACASHYFSLLPCHSQLNALPPPIFHLQLSALFQSQSLSLSSSMSWILPWTHSTQIMIMMMNACFRNALVIITNDVTLLYSYRMYSFLTQT